MAETKESTDKPSYHAAGKEDIVGVDRKMFRSNAWEHFGWHKKAIGSSWVVCYIYLRDSPSIPVHVCIAIRQKDISRIEIYRGSPASIYNRTITIVRTDSESCFIWLTGLTTTLHLHLYSSRTHATLPVACRTTESNVFVCQDTA